MRKRKKFYVHYRKNRDTHHLTYIYKQTDKDYSFIGCTHGAYTHHKRNVPLPDNPNSLDKQKAYALEEVDSSKKDRFYIKRNLERSLNETETFLIQ